MARTTSTFSCDIIYSESPAAWRALERLRKPSALTTLPPRTVNLLVRLDRLPFDLIIRSSTCLRSDGASRSQYPRPTVESHITAAQTFVPGTRLDAFRT